MRTLILSWMGCLMLSPACSAVEPAETFRAELETTYQAAADATRQTVKGQDGWLFHAGELRFLSLGSFWGDKAASVSRASAPTSMDPLPAIVSFHEALQSRGVELIVLPVPPKAVVYPEPITSLPAGTRYDNELQEFYAALRDQGVQVLDLTKPFMAMDEPAYCKTDTHWSPAACAVAAREIAAHIADRPWLGEVPRQAFSSESGEITFVGDLWEGLGEADPQPETLAISRISRSENGAGVPVAHDPASPVILMGDSHTLVFQDGTLLASQGGLPDLLSITLGFELDLQFRNKGSGSSLVRKSMVRKQISGSKKGDDYLASKKLAIWCFTARDFTEATDGWPVIPATLFR